MQTWENLYDKYASSLYGALLQILNDEQIAGDILVKVFNTAINQNQQEFFQNTSFANLFQLAVQCIRNDHPHVKPDYKIFFTGLQRMVV
jgi:hypothetical protein